MWSWCSWWSWMKDAFLGEMGKWTTSEVRVSIFFESVSFRETRVCLCTWMLSSQRWQALSQTPASERWRDDGGVPPSRSGSIITVIQHIACVWQLGCRALTALTVFFTAVLSCEFGGTVIDTRGRVSVCVLQAWRLEQVLVGVWVPEQDMRRDRKLKIKDCLLACMLEFSIRAQWDERRRNLNVGHYGNFPVDWINLNNSLHKYRNIDLQFCVFSWRQYLI